MTDPELPDVMTTKSQAQPGSISVVIPIGPNEVAAPMLFSDFNFLPPGAEVILVPSFGRDCSHLYAQVDLYPHLLVKVVMSAPGRARQLNEGAKAATRQWLWFLHADSRLGIAQVIALRQGIAANPNSLLYFNLSFLGDGPPLMVINVAGAWIRSHVFKLPFGDQGFSIRGDSFFSIGGFDEGIEKGEDFFFVRAATKSGIRVNCTGGMIKTSARKYRTNGWLLTTGQHLFWTLRQVGPKFNALRNLRGGGENETRRGGSIR